MQKSTFTRLYKEFRVRLKEMRQNAELSQRDLARRLGREPSFVARIEQGERRVDVVEFFWIARACGADPRKEANLLMDRFKRLEKKR